jgi:hypothetical protein
LKRQCDRQRGRLTGLRVEADVARAGLGHTRLSDEGVVVDLDRALGDPVERDLDAQQVVRSNGGEVADIDCGDREPALAAETTPSARSSSTGARSPPPYISRWRARNSSTTALASGASGMSLERYG